MNPGSIVQISTLDSKCNTITDPNEYELIKFDKNSAELLIKLTGKMIKVHPSRIVKVVTASENKMSSNDYTKIPGELWSKEFEHKASKAHKNVLILLDKRSYYCFNTYDKVGTIGTMYSFADEKAYDKRVAKLLKDGYSLLKQE